MDNNLYEKLIDSLCLQRGIENGEDVRRTGSIWIDDVRFWLLFDAESAPDTLKIYCDYGAIPEDRIEDVLRVLLEENANLFAYSGPRFMINPNGGSVLLADDYVLSRMTPQELLEILDYMAKNARKWQINFYLDERSSNERAVTSNFSHDFA